MLRGTISCKEDVKEQVEGGNRRGGTKERGGNRRGERKERGNKKEVPSLCPELPNSAATPSKKHSAKAIEDVVSN